MTLRLICYSFWIRHYYYPRGIWKMSLKRFAQNLHKETNSCLSKYNMLATIYSNWLSAKLIFHKIDMQWTVSQLNTNGTNVYLNVGKFYCAQTSKMQHKPKLQTTGTCHDLWTIFYRNVPFAWSTHVLRGPAHPFLGISIVFSPIHCNVLGMTKLDHPY